MHTPGQSRDPNGLDLTTVAGTWHGIEGHPELAHVRLRARNRWIRGARSRSISQDFHAALRRQPHLRSFVFELDFPQLLGGDDTGPTPAEFLLYGIAGDLTAVVAMVASERDVELAGIEVEVEGHLDARPLLGVRGAARPGYERIDIAVKLTGDAASDELDAIVEAARRRAPVVDSVTRSVPVAVVATSGGTLRTLDR